MELTFWGVRGSIPTPGPHTQRWGGNSACIELRHGDLPPLVLDCGTGARPLGMKLLREPGRALDVLFTHFHMDHIFGFPFFAPIYTPGYDVCITAGGFAGEEIRQKLGRYLNGVYHPVRIRELLAQVEYRAVRPGQAFEARGFQVMPARLNHPGGALGYRISVGGRSVVYVSDTAPFARLDEGVAAGKEPTLAERRMIELLAGADLVVYDTMYDFDEYLEKMTWGHSYPEYAAAICRAADVSKLVLFHHLPDADDGALDERAARFSASHGIAVQQAREGETISAG